MPRITQDDVGPVRATVEAFGRALTFTRSYHAQDRDAAIAMIRLAIGTLDQDHPDIPIHEYRVVISLPREKNFQTDLTGA